ncbi:unnamed protein product [Ectocarpus sp. 12 AP-2014]
MMGKADDDEENPSGWMVLSEGRRHARCASSGTVRVGGGASGQSARMPPSPPENKQLTNAALRTLCLRGRLRAPRRAGRKSMVLWRMYVCSSCNGPHDQTPSLPLYWQPASPGDSGNARNRQTDSSVAIPTTALVRSDSTVPGTSPVCSEGFILTM